MAVLSQASAQNQEQGSCEEQNRVQQKEPFGFQHSNGIGKEIYEVVKVEVRPGDGYSKAKADEGYKQGVPPVDLPSSRNCQGQQHGGRQPQQAADGDAVEIDFCRCFPHWAMQLDSLRYPCMKQHEQLPPPQYHQNGCKRMNGNESTLYIFNSNFSRNT